MSRPIDDDGAYYDRRSDPNRADREISLGTPTLLGIFFGIALLCAGFFGFGYSMGHSSARSAQAAAAASAPAYGDSAAIKPSAASPAGHPLTPSVPPAEVAPSQSAAVETPQTAVVSIAPSTTPGTVAPSDRIIAGDKPIAPAAQPAASNPQPANSFVVQVAAVSSQDVADILLSNLQKKGYDVAVRHEPQDKLLHVQIGPFPDRKDAEAMQKRVLADGFNAIVK